MTDRRVAVVATSPRVAPGLLCASAWELLRAGPVLVRSADHPQLAAVQVDAQVVDGPDAAVVDRLWQLLADQEQVVWLAEPGADADLVRAVGRRCLTDRTVTLEVVHGSYDLPGARLIDVVSVMDRLRSPGGCPWDARQTHRSLLPYLVEETYEAYQAIEDGDLAGLREELGDVLLQVAFHARIASESGWDLDDVATDLVDKLTRRHPHVFAGASADDLEGSWAALKQAEKGRTSAMDGIPFALPALALAAMLQKRGDRIGAPLPSYDGVAGQIWQMVTQCRAEGVDPEAELRRLASDYRDRVLAHESEG